MWRYIILLPEYLHHIDSTTRPKSVGELYAYLPLTPGNSTHLLAVPPSSKANPDYGYSVGRGSFHLGTAVGQWVSVAFRVKLNDHGVDNGYVPTRPIPNQSR